MEAEDIDVEMEDAVPFPAAVVKFKDTVDAWAANNGNELFPINFDSAWQLVGYSTKGNAKRKLKSMVKGRDYVIIIHDKKASAGGRPVEIIKLTADAFKQFCMMAQTPLGEQVRLYFIDVEKRHRALGQAILEGKIDLVRGSNYVERRVKSADKCISLNATIRQTMPEATVPIYASVHSDISRAATGQRPNELLRRPDAAGARSARDMMDEVQLAATFLMQEIARKRALEEQYQRSNGKAFADDMRQRCNIFHDNLKEIHGIHQAPTDLAEIRRIHEGSGTPTITNNNYGCNMNITNNTFN